MTGSVLTLTDLALRYLCQGLLLIAEGDSHVTISPLGRKHW